MFQVFDYEAYNWNKAYAVGIYDGSDLKILAEDGKDNFYFTEWLLENLKDRIIAYAHYGGRYDFMFIFEYCEKYKLKPYGLKLINGTVAEFRLKYKNKTLIFRDSGLILPASLKRLTYDFNVEHKKLEMDYDIGLKDARFKDYFTNDLKGLYEVLDISNLISHLTIASSAMYNFSHIFYLDKMERNTDSVERFFRDAYKGGRTEIFKLYGKDLNYYDINSLYPSVMYDFEYPLPIKNNFKKVFKLNKDKLGVYNITAEVEDLQIPVLHKNINGKFIFPVGRLNGLYYTQEILKAVEMGYKIKVNYGYEFLKTGYIFKSYVEHFYNLKKTETGSKRAIAKLMLNSLYGKFGQRRDREVHHLVVDGSLSNLNYSAKKYWDSETDFIHPEIAGMITANARTRLYNLFQKAGLDRVYYCDTDSIITDTVLSTSNELGDIKQEDRIKEFIALRPKLYGYLNVNKEIIIKAKGFKEGNINFADFENGLFKQDLTGFEENRDKMASFKERFIRNDVSHFADLIKINKHLRGFYDKREILNDFSTKPLKINVN